MAVDKQEALRHLDDILKRRGQLHGRKKDQGHHGLVQEDIAFLVTLYRSAIDRYAPPRSQYRLLLREVRLKKYEKNAEYLRLLDYEGVVRGLRDDVADDRLKTFSELVHADLFDGMLMAADHLLGEGYIDIAAVMAGGVLEEHLRKLCDKHNISRGKLNTRTKKQEPLMLQGLNDTLASKKNLVYPRSDQSQIEGWTKIRNDPAHGKYNQHTDTEVRLMIQGIRHFISRYPA